jgi:hypothetical protein
LPLLLLLLLLLPLALNGLALPFGSVAPAVYRRLATILPCTFPAIGIRGVGSSNFRWLVSEPCKVCLVEEAISVGATLAPSAFIVVAAVAVVVVVVVVVALIQRVD